MEHKTSLFGSNPANDVSVNPELYAYERSYYGLSSDDAAELGTIRLYIALCMLKHNKFAHDLIIDRVMIARACGRLYNLVDLAEISVKDWENMSLALDIVSDRFVDSNGCIDFQSVSKVYSEFGFSRTEGFIQEISKLMGAVKPEVLMAAVCIMFACPGVYVYMRKGDFKQASHYVVAASKVLERLINEVK